VLVLIAAMLLSACSTTSVVDDWAAEKGEFTRPEKVAVIAVLPEALMRKAVEIDVAKVLVKDGVNAVPSSNIKGMGGGIRGEIDPEVATGLLRRGGVDGVVIMFYSGGDRSEGYVRSDYWAEYLGSGMGYSWSQPYFTNVYTVRKGPGWADYQQIAYVESSYYDMDTEKPAWRIVTRTKDLEHSDAANDIARKISSEMKSAGLR
jgi:hypothetical protein